MRQLRLDGAAGRIAELENRLADGAQEQKRLDDLPGNIAKRRMEIGDQLEQGENARQKRQMRCGLLAKLAEAEALQRDATQHWPKHAKSRSAPRAIGSCTTDWAI